MDVKLLASRIDSVSRDSKLGHDEIDLTKTEQSAQYTELQNQQNRSTKGLSCNYTSNEKSSIVLLSKPSTPSHGRLSALKQITFAERKHVAMAMH